MKKTIGPDKKMTIAISSSVNLNERLGVYRILCNRLNMSEGSATIDTLSEATRVYCYQQLLKMYLSETFLRPE